MAPGPSPSQRYSPVRPIALKWPCVAQVWGHRGSCLCSSWWRRTEQQHDPAAADATASWRTVIHPHKEIPQCGPLPLPDPPPTPFALTLDLRCMACQTTSSCGTLPKAGWVDVGGMSGAPWSCASNRPPSIGTLAGAHVLCLPATPTMRMQT